MKRKFTYQEVFDCFRQHGYVLLTKTYAHSKQKLKCLCPNGHPWTTELRNFRSGKRCRICGRTKAYETMKKRYGSYYFQTSKFLKNRKRTYLKRFGVDSPLKNKSVMRKRDKTNMSKYGVKHVSQVPEIRKKQKDGLLRSHGVEYTMQSQAIRNKFRETLLRKYGVPSLAYLSRCASKESQKLFAALIAKLPSSLRNKTYFANNNSEFVISYKGKCYKYDFVNSMLKKCIEYNGIKFHPADRPDSAVGWCVFHPNLTAREAREKEKAKLAAIKRRGYDVLIVWDVEFKKNPTSTIDKCLDFLTY